MLLVKNVYYLRRNFQKQFFMKKVILTVTVLVFGVITSFAQTEPKESNPKNDKVLFKNKKNNFKSGSQSFQAYDLFLSGTVLYRGEKGSDDSKLNGVTFSPRIGYFINDNIAVGIDLNLASRKSELNLRSVVTRDFGIGGFGRYYCSKNKGRFSLFTQLGVNYLSGKEETTVGVENTSTNQVDYTVDIDKENGFGIGLSGGFNYFISNHFALETLIGVLDYNSLKADVPGAKARSNFNIGINLNNIGFGLLYKF